MKQGKVVKKHEAVTPAVSLHQGPLTAGRRYLSPVVAVKLGFIFVAKTMTILESISLNCLYVELC